MTEATQAGTGEATRATPGEGLRPGPEPWTVLRKQLRLVYLKRRWELLFLTVAAALSAFLLLTEPFGGPDVTLSDLLLGSGLYALVAFLALLWPGGVWSDEGPGDRAYHWSLPVRRPVHDLTRVAVGAAWYLAAVVTGLAAGTLILLVGWGRLAPVVSPGLLGLAVLVVLLVYGIGSLAALLSDHPYRWLLVGWIGYIAVRLTLEALAARAALFGWLRDGLAAVWEGSYGLQAALSAPHLVAAAGRGVESGASPHPMGALFLWLALVAAALVGVSLLHLERARGAAE